MPIAVLGRGTVSAEATGLSVVGTRTHRSPLFVLGVIIAMCAIAFAVGMFTDPNALAQRVTRKLSLGAAIALAIGALAAAIVLGRGKLVPWHFTLPWSSVRDVKLAGREVIMTIKGAKPKGTLHFVPDAGGTALVSAIESMRR
jgi:hypothetical protein